jgi:tetratricopeptide (TPR) repeat protein
MEAITGASRQEEPRDGATETAEEPSRPEIPSEAVSEVASETPRPETPRAEQVEQVERGEDSEIDGEGEGETYKSNRDFITRKVKRGSADWVKDTARGIVNSAAMVLFTMLLVQVGVMSEANEFSFDLFSPYEFWKSFTGLVVTWSQWNEWLLLGLALVGAAVTVGVYLRWRAYVRTHPVEEEEYETGPDGKPRKKAKPFFKRTEDVLNSMKTVTTVGMIAALLFGAYAYQQYLWNVELPVPQDKIGVAFTRQIGSTVAVDKLADALRQMGHEGQIVMRNLPVTFDARDTAQAQELARRIGAQAVVIYREEDAPASASGSATGPDGMAGLASPPLQAATATTPTARYTAYVVFADPQMGVEIPVPQRATQGGPQTLAFKTKEGVEIPRLETTDLGRLMEATAGVLLYDKDRYLPAISHLTNALPPAGEATTESDALIYYYLGAAHYLLNEDEKAAEAYDRGIEIYAANPRPTLQDRLTYARALATRGLLHFNAGDAEAAERTLAKAVALRQEIDRDQSALSDPATFRRVHETFGNVYVYRMQIEQRPEGGDPDAANLWAERARQEAQALLSQEEDWRGRLSGIWMTYRTGDCEGAYSLGQDLLAADADSLYGHQVIWRIAAMRDKLIVNSESKLHIDEMARLNPRDLPTLQILSSYYTMAHYFNEPGYVEDLRETLDAILEVDPYNVGALDNYVSLMYFKTLPSLDLSASPIFYSTGDERTFYKTHEDWIRDPRRTRDVLAEIDTAREYVTRWKEEMQPGEFLPVFYAARLSSNAEARLYEYKFTVGDDKALSDLYEPAWHRAVKDAEAALDPSLEHTPYERIQALSLAMTHWVRLYWIGAMQQDDEKMRQAVESNLEYEKELVALLEANPPGNQDESGYQMNAYVSLANHAGIAGLYYGKAGDDARKAEYNEVFQQRIARWSELIQQGNTNIQQGVREFERALCPTGELKIQARQIAAEEGNAKAVEDLVRYTELYPGDPAGYVDLGWYRYVSGDLEGALAATEQAIALNPKELVALGNRPLMLAALGRDAEVAEAERSFLAALESKRPGESLPVLTAHTIDLVLESRDKEKLRPAIGTMVAEIENHLDSMPAEMREDYPWHLVPQRNNLGAISIWVGDYDRALRNLDEALRLNPEYALGRSNVGLAKIASGDDAGAMEAYRQAISIADGYLVDSEGKERTDNLETWIGYAHGDLSNAIGALATLVEQRPDLADAALPALDLLTRATASYQEQMNPATP